MVFIWTFMIAAFVIAQVAGPLVRRTGVREIDVG